MADNVTITKNSNATPPPGTVIATDDVSGAQYQRVKLDVGADGVSTPAVAYLPVRQTTNIDLDYARRQVSGARSFFFFGINDLVGTADAVTWTDIWPANTDINWLQTAGQIEITSTNAADSASGLGCQSVEVHGLDASGNDQSEVIELSGVTTTTAATLSYIRVNKVHNETVGTYGGSHQGDISVNLKTGGVLLAKMTGSEGAVNSDVLYGSGEAGNGFWSVPLGKVMYVTRLSVIPNFGASNKTVSVALYEREGILTVAAPFLPRRVLWQEEGIEGPLVKTFKSHLKIKELTDIYFRAAATAVSKVQVSLDFYLVDADGQGA